jgi:hypothetical protein
MDLASGIAAATQALGIAKTLRSVEKSYDQATYKAQLADLMSALADAKLALTDAREALSAKDKEIAELKTSFAAQAELIVSDGGYKFFRSESGQPVGFPVCPNCELDGKLVQLKQNGAVTQARCPACMTEYQPVTCFLPPEQNGDVTLLAREQRLKKERQDRTNAALARLNSRSGWVV